MKLVLPALLALTAAPVFAQETTSPKRVVVGQSSQFALQGWTRLNGTSAFQAPKEATQAAPAPATEDTAARRARLLEAEAAYQAQKSKASSGW